MKLKPSLTQPTRYLFALGLVLSGWGSAFAPWLWRESVALQLTGPGLAEFVKFLSEVRSGAIQVGRLFFLYPLFWSMLAIPLLVENQALSLPGWLRLALRLVVLPLALAALSPVWTPAVLIAPEFRAQTLLAGLAVGLSLVAPRFNRLPYRPALVALFAGGLAALILPWYQFGLVQAPLSAVYNSPVSLGWGWWLTVAGIALGLAGGSGLALRSRQDEAK